MKLKNKALLCDFGLLATALVWGGGFVVVKNSLKGISPYWLLAARFTFAALLLVLLFFPRLRKIPVRTVGAGVFAGIFVYFGFLAQTIGIQYTTASKNALLTASYVVFTPLIFWLFGRKRPHSTQLLAALLCFAGVGLLVYQKGMQLTQLNRGDLYTLLCGFLFAVQIAYLGIASKKHDPIALTLVQMCSCCVLSIAVALFMDRSAFPAQVGRDTLVSVLYLTVLCTVFAYLMQTVAQKYTPPAHVSILLSLECLFGCICSVLAFGDAFTPLMWVGAALTFCAVLMSQRTEEKG